METPVVSLKQILEDAGISRVYAVDDYFDRPDLDTAIGENLPEARKYFENLTDLVGDNDADIILMRGIASEMTDDKRKEAYFSIMGGSSTILPQDKLHLEALATMVRATELELKKCSVSEFLTEIQSWPTESDPANGKAIIFIDLDLRDCSEFRFKNDRGGLDLILECLKNYPHVKSCITFSVLTNYCEIDAELSLHSKLMKERNDLNGEEFIVLSKKRLDDRPNDSMNQGIQYALINRDVLGVRTGVINIFENALKSASKNFNALALPVFFQGIFKAAMKEGADETEYITRALQAMVDDELARAFSVQDMGKDFRKKLDMISKISRGLDQSPDSEFRPELLKLMHKERFESDSVNKRYAPIANGDVFEISGKEYLLLAQPCDLQLRDKGIRATDVVTLLSVTKIDPPTERCIKAMKKYHVETKLGNALKVRYWDEHGLSCKLSFAKDSIQLSLEILDLCSTNVDGKCVFDAIKLEEATGFMSSSSRKRIKILKDRMIKLIREYRKDLDTCVNSHNSIKERNRLLMSSSREREDELVKSFNLVRTKEVIRDAHFLEISRAPKIMPQNIDENNERFDYNIRRTKRIREPYASYHLLAYSQNRARPGFPGELLYHLD